MTYKELVYMALDALKIHSDDSKFTEDHVVFLLNKYRAFVLDQKYSKNNIFVDRSNYQSKEILFNPSSDGNSFDVIPNILKIDIPELSFAGIVDTPSISTITEDDKKKAINKLHNTIFTFVNKERFSFVGHNRFLKNVVYYTIKKNGYLYISRSIYNNINPSIHFKFKVTAIFEDPIVNDNNNILDQKFPLESSLVPSVLELVLKDLTNGIYKPSDNLNDAQDALSDLAGYLRRNMKSQFQKQIDE